MFFLLRCAFWICVVLALLPFGSPQPVSKEAGVGALDALSAAGAAVSDMGQFCDRQPEACEIGSKAALALGVRAQAGAKILYEFVTEKMAPSETGSVGAQKGPKALPSQHTLNPSDMEPAWRGPQPRPDAAPKRPT